MLTTALLLTSNVGVDCCWAIVGLVTPLVNITITILPCSPATLQRPMDWGFHGVLRGNHQGSIVLRHSVFGWNWRASWFGTGNSSKCQGVSVSYRHTNIRGCIWLVHLDTFVSVCVSNINTLRLHLDINYRWATRERQIYSYKAVFWYVSWYRQSQWLPK